MDKNTPQPNNFWHKFYRVYLKIWRVLLSLVLIASAAGIYFFFFSGAETVKAGWWPLARWANGPEGTTPGYRI
ncbi:MAG: hypothetical protein V1867_00015 [Candidatus Falkowbacteria bacterium]